MKILLLICALWSSMYVDPSNGEDGEDITYEVNVGDMVKGEEHDYKFTCYGVLCEPHKIFARYKKGGLQLAGFADLVDFHSGFCWDNVQKNPQTCDFDYITTNLPTTNTFYVEIKAKNSTSDVKLTVRGNIKGAELYYKSYPDSRSTFQMEVGDMAQGTLKYFLIWCKPIHGRCFLNGMSVETTSGKVKIQGLPSVEINSFAFCYNDYYNYSPDCVFRYNQSLPKKNFFYVELTAKDDSKNVRIIVKGNAFAAGRYIPSDTEA